MSRTLIKPLTKEKKELSLNGNCVFSLVSHSRGSPHLSVCIRVHPWPKNQTSKADRTPKKQAIWPRMDTDTHGCGVPASSRSTGRRLEQNCMVMFWRNAY